MAGKVFLVGAGPGDPGLLTVRGRELLLAADAVLYDALVAPEILEGLPSSCERVFVGKRAGEPSMTQDAINQELVRRAQSGQRVVRLKGGDPYVFGRGGEEAAACREAGVAFDVVPGVTSAIAVPACAGIPVVHRAVASSVLILHGSIAPLRNGDEPPAESGKPAGVIVRRRRKSDEDLAADASGGEEEEEYVDLSRVAHAADTLVFLMGVRSLDTICSGLIEAGRDARTPAALIQWGTTPRQKTITGTLQTLPGLVHASSAGTPGVIIVGEVVRLRETLETFEHRPLFGRRIAIVEPPEHYRPLRDALTDAGARLYVVPCHANPPLATSDAEERRLQMDLREATHLVVLRPWLVRQMVEGMRAWGIDPILWCRTVQVLAVGDETRRALAYYGIGSHLVGEDVTSEDFVKAWHGKWQGTRAIVVEPASEWIEVSEELESRGVRVASLALDEFVPRPEGARELERLVTTRKVDTVVFESVTGARSLRTLLGAEGFASLLEGVLVTATSASVAAALESLGRPVAEAPEEWSPSEFIERLMHERRGSEHETTEVDA